MFTLVAIIIASMLTLAFIVLWDLDRQGMPQELRIAQVP